MAHDQDEDLPEDHYARCPDCDFIETEITDKKARELQKNGCPNCDDSRSLGVAHMDVLPA